MARSTRLRVLTYHRVGPPRRAGYEKLTVAPGRFVRQVKCLRALGYTVSELDLAPRLAAGEPCAVRRPVVLTFDDGFGDLYDHVLPTLAAQALPAVVYVVTDRRRADWTDWDGLEPPALLDRSQLREMAAAGVSIGSHGRTHARLTRCSPGQLSDEVGGSKKAIEDLLGREVRHFCYPYGRANEAVAEAVREAGYHTACTTERGCVRPGADVLRLPRLVVGKRMGLLHFARRLVFGR
ncbi:MAG: polysaccharide deacetylase family protein [Candidatus Brocadiia bacterium]